VGKTDTAAARGNAATNRGRIAEPGRRGDPHYPALALANGTGRTGLRGRMPVVWGLAPAPSDEPVNAVKSSPSRRLVATLAAVLLGGSLVAGTPARAAEPLPAEVPLADLSFRAIFQASPDALPDIDFHSL
jgi:hypothetical protein